MDTAAILDKLEALLDEERTSIRALRGPRVHEIACEKLDLMKRLDAMRGAGWKEHTPRVKEIVRRVRHNSVLLVQAKSVLAEAIRCKRARLASRVAASSIPARVSAPAASRLSVVG